MQEPFTLPGSPVHQSAADQDDLVEKATRCYRLACGMSNSEFTRQLVALGKQYAAQAIAGGADPSRLPAPEDWPRASGMTADSVATES